MWKVQQKEITALTKCKTKEVQYEKSATRENCTLEIAKHEIVQYRKVQHD